jgi:hypothetical protein
VLLRDNVVPILSDGRKHSNVHVQPIDQTQDARYRSENQLSGRISRLKTWMFHHHPLFDGGKPDDSEGHELIEDGSDCCPVREGRAYGAASY